jgi:hypothetical protein
VLDVALQKMFDRVVDTIYACLVGTVVMAEVKRSSELDQKEKPRRASTKQRQGSGPHAFIQPKNVLPKYQGGQGRKVYVVRRGYVSGLYYSWDECSRQVKGFSGAEFWRFRNWEEALAWLRN